MSITIRRANKDDLLTITELALKLYRQHQAYDPIRFVSFSDLETQLFHLFTEKIEGPDAVIVIAEIDRKIAGYAYVKMEEASLVELSDRCAWLHDIFVDESARGHNLGNLLLEASKKVARELGSPILMLHVSPKNEFARKLFESRGFRPTMHEMMSEL